MTRKAFAILGGCLLALMSASSASTPPCKWREILHWRCEKRAKGFKSTTTRGAGTTESLPAERSSTMRRVAAPPSSRRYRLTERRVQRVVIGGRRGRSHDAGGLELRENAGIRLAKQDVNFLAAQGLGHFLERLYAGDVHEGHAVQPQNQVARQRVRFKQRALEFFDRAEEHRSGDFINDYPGRKFP